jgi:serine/threonine-protein kinase HipA
MKLKVFFGKEFAGVLASTADQGVVFSYDDSYRTNKSNSALSISMPLSKKEYSQKECLPFFSGLLPEGDVKRRVSDFLHVSESSTLKLLQELGGECAGMISILPENKNCSVQKSYAFNNENYELLDDETLYGFIKNINVRPLLKAKKELRLSLAGAQEKLPLVYFDKKFYLPKSDAPSTHIVKPSGDGELSTLSINEFVCMKLAQSCGLNVPNVELKTINNTTFLLEERYDRIVNKKSIKRLHQEDFCQALGIMSDRKYQNDNGPDIAKIYSLIQKECTIPLLDTKEILKYVIFNFIIGNCDAHGKNYSLLYEKGSSKLSPIYDAICTLVYPSLTKKMSMKIGKHYEILKVTKQDFVELATSINLKSSIVLKMLDETITNITNGFDKIRNEKSLAPYQDFLDKLENHIKRELRK